MSAAMMSGRLIIAGYHQDGPRQVDMQQWNWRGLDVINAHERDPAVAARGLREAMSAVDSGSIAPFPSALEAAQAGCALVLGDIDSLHEIRGDAALYVAPDDHDELAAMLRRLIADPVLRAQYVARARKRAARYAPETMVGEYRRAYRELETGRSDGSPRRPIREALTAGAAR